MSASGYTPWSVTAGEMPTTAYWNILGGNDASFNTGSGFNDGIIGTRHIASGIQIAQQEQNPYKFSVYLNSAQNSANGSAHITLNAKLFDTASNFDTTNYVFIAPIAGFWQFNYSVTSAGASPGFWQAYLYKNNTTVVSYGAAFATTNFAQSVGSRLVQLNQNDTIGLWLVATGVDAIQTLSTVTFLDGYLESNT